MKTCSVEGCDRSYFGKGFCNKHWQRWKKGNDPHRKSQFEKTPEERLMERISPAAPVTGCMEWMGGRSGDGYGSIKVNGIQTAAHRYAYEIAFGTIPDGLFVCHHCDNPICCNKDHMFLGTPKDNMDDMARKGRKPRPKGNPSGNPKLTNENIAEIRRRLATGKESQQKIADSFGVNQVTISMIKLRKTWTKI
jgi:hypothetical protein